MRDYSKPDTAYKDAEDVIGHTVKRLHPDSVIVDAQVWEAAKRLATDHKEELEATIAIEKINLTNEQLEQYAKNCETNEKTQAMISEIMASQVDSEFCAEGQIMEYAEVLSTLDDSLPVFRMVKRIAEYVLGRYFKEPSPAPNTQMKGWGYIVYDEAEIHEATREPNPILRDFVGIDNCASTDNIMYVTKEDAILAAICKVKENYEKTLMALDKLYLEEWRCRTKNQV